MQGVNDDDDDDKKKKLSSIKCIHVPSTMLSALSTLLHLTRDDFWGQLSILRWGNWGWDSPCYRGSGAIGPGTLRSVLFESIGFLCWVWKLPLLSSESPGSGHPSSSGFRLQARRLWSAASLEVSSSCGHWTWEALGLSSLALHVVGCCSSCLRLKQP